MKNVVGYARVSTQEQADSGLSIEAQKSKITQFCQFKGLNLLEIIVEEGVSGTVPLDERPGGSRLLKLTQSQKVDVVASRLDRLFRDAHDCLGVTKDWEKRGNSLHLLDLGIDMTTPMGRAFLSNAATYAELERNLIAQRTKDAMSELKKQGVAIGAAKYGWHYSDQVDDKGRRLLVPDDKEIDILVECKALRASGMSYQKIADKFNAEGKPTKKGKAWYASTVRNCCIK